MVQLKSPAIFAVGMDGLGDMCRGVRDTIYWRSTGVYRDDEICSGRGGSILRFGHRKSELTMESATEWREEICHFSI